MPAGFGDQIGRWLAANAGAQLLASDEIQRYANNGAVRGWRLDIEVRGQVLALDLTIERRFPRRRPRIVLVEPPPFPNYPHVEDDGCICGIGEIDELDCGQPTEIIKAALGAA